MFRGFNLLKFVRAAPLPSETSAGEAVGQNLGSAPGPERCLQSSEYSSEVS